jgi:hypothetical protein
VTYIPVWRKTIAALIVAVPGVVVLLLERYDGTSIALALLAVCGFAPLLLTTDQVSASFTRGFYSLAGLATGALGAVSLLSALDWWWVALGAVVGGLGWMYAATLAAGPDRVVVVAELSAAGTYFSRPFTGSVDPAARWTHRTFDRVSLFIVIAVSLCGVAVLAFVIYNLIDGAAGTSILGPIFVFVLFFPVVAIFWLTAITTYRIDARGFSTAGGFGWRRTTITPDEVARVGVTSTGDALIDDYADLDEAAKAERDTLVGAFTQTASHLYADSSLGIFLVIETTRPTSTGGREATGVLLKRPDVPALVAAAALLDSRHA